MKKAIVAVALALILGYPAFTQEAAEPAFWVSPFGGFVFLDSGQTNSYSAYGGLVFHADGGSFAIDAQIPNVLDPLLFDVDFKLAAKFDVGATFDFFATLGTAWDLRTPGDESFVADTFEFGAAFALGEYFGAEVVSGLELVSNWLKIPMVEVTVFFGERP